MGNTLLYNDEAPATTAAIAQSMAGAINRKLGDLSTADGVQYDEVYSASIGHASSLIGWAAQRGQPPLALELALFGGRDESLSAATQRRLTEYALTVMLAELQILPRSAVQEVIHPTAAAGQPRHPGVRRK